MVWDDRRKVWVALGLAAMGHGSNIWQAPDSPRVRVQEAASATTAGSGYSAWVKAWG